MEKSELRSVGLPTPVTPLVTRLRLIMTGATISVNVNGTQQISVADTSVTAAGKAGGCFAGTQSTTAGIAIDNFRAR